jgi:hypothetical protein
MEAFDIVKTGRELGLSDNRIAEMAEQEIIRRATLAYCKWAGRQGGLVNQPGAGSEVIGNVVTLRNVNGVLARYRIKGDKLQRIGATAR